MNRFAIASPPPQRSLRFRLRELAEGAHGLLRDGWALQLWPAGWLLLAGLVVEPPRPLPPSGSSEYGTVGMADCGAWRETLPPMWNGSGSWALSPCLRGC